MAGLVAELIEAGRIDASWNQALSPVEDVLEVALTEAKIDSRGFLPEQDNVLRAFRMPLDAVRVLILGQDPYPTPGRAVGLSFSVARHVRPLPKSLANIYRELYDDLGIPAAGHGDLSVWEAQGVMLLNRVLTVAPGDAGSHRGIGWEKVTERAISALAARDEPLVAVLWGRDAQATAALLGDTPLIESAHPSPLSARRGFFGSRPFSTVNELLKKQGTTPIDWRVEDEALYVD